MPKKKSNKKKKKKVKQPPKFSNLNHFEDFNELIAKASKPVKAIEE